MAAVGRPRRIFVSPDRRQLLHRALADVQHEDLQGAADVTVKRYRESIRGPIGRIGGPRYTIVEGSEELLIGPVGAHHVNLRQTRAGRDEGDATPVRTVGRGQVVRIPAYGQAL